MNILYRLTLSLSLGLYATASQAMEKETFHQKMPLHTKSKTSLTYHELCSFEEKNLKRLKVIKSLMERSVAQLKATIAVNADGLPTSKEANKILRDYQKALLVMERAQSIYEKYSNNILEVSKRQSSEIGYNFMRYIKLLACSIELDIISQKVKDSYLTRYKDNFKEFVNERKQSFTDDERYWADFINVQDFDDIRLSNAQIAHEQLRQFRNINNIMDRIDLDKFTFNHPSYKALVARHLQEFKTFCRSKISSYRATNTIYVENSRVNIVTADIFYFDLMWVQNKANIGNAYSFIFDMLDLRFVDGRPLPTEFYHLYPLEKCVMLSDQQREENKPIFLSMLMTAENALSIQKPVHVDNKKDNRGKKALKRQRKKAQAPSPYKSLKRAQKGEERKVELQHNEEAEAAQDIQPDIAMAPFIPSGQQQSLQGTSEKEVPLQEEPLPDPLLECKVWLQDIMKKSASQQGEYFPIFHKAHSLLKDLENNNELVLLAVQEATCTLAERLNDLANRQESDKKKINNKLVPKNYENDYFLFMETPVTYLHNNIRFGIVRRLVKGLGGEIDDTRSGSRINLTLNKAHTSIHLHDAHNGLLEGGRIMSLRKFFIEANLCVNF